MAPSTMEAPVETGGDFDAALDDFQSTVNGAADEGQQATPVEHAADEVPGGEAPTSPEQTPGDASQPGGEGPTSEYQLSEDGSHYLVPKDQLGIFQTNREYLQKVQERFPTLADATEAHQLSGYWNQMTQDFLYNGDAGVDKVLGYLLGKNVDAAHPEMFRQFQDGFVRMATKMPQILEGMAPEAHRSVVNSLVQPYVQGLYEYAAETNDPAILKAAQNVDWAFNGKYLAEAPKFDPNAQRIHEQQQREQALTNRETAIRNNEWSAHDQKYLEGAKRTEYNAELDRALAPFKDKYDPDTFADIRDGISRRVIAKLQEDKIWANNHSGQFTMLKKGFETGWQPGKPINIQAANIWKNDFMTRVRKYLPSIAESRFKAVPPNKGTTARTTRQPAPARTTAPARAQNGQFTREQQDAAFDAGVSDLTKSVFSF